MARPTDKGLITKAKLTAIGAALRKLFGGTKQYTPDEMATAINGIEKNTSSDLTVNGRTVTAPAGYYAAAAEKSIPTGVPSSLTVVKGDVVTLTGGVRALEVTPYLSVTSAGAGYFGDQFTAGTKTRITASEIVDGTKDITSNGTYRVDDYKSVFVNVPETFEWDIWRINENPVVVGELAGEMDVSLSYPMFVASSRQAGVFTFTQIYGINVYYQDSSSTYEYIDYFFTPTTSTNVWSATDGTSNGWSNALYRFIKVPRLLRDYIGVASAPSNFQIRRIADWLNANATRLE